MPIPAVCDACGKQYRVADALAGKRVKCRDCGHSFAVPGQGQPTPSSPPPLPADRPVFPIDPPSPVQDESPILKYTLWIGIPLVLLGILATTLGIWMNRAVPQPVVQAAPPQVSFQPVYPTRPAATHPFADVDRYDIQLPAQNGYTAMALSVYLPAGRHDAKSLPCVFIAPAGSWMHGMVISDGDRPEHYPYVHAGFAVICYELTGSPADPAKKKPTYADLDEPTRLFRMATGGIANAERAMDYAVDRVPEVNPAQFYACGHSSAAVVALDVAAVDSRIRACCAYAPRTDVEAWWKPAGMNTQLPDFDEFAAFHSPLRHVDKIRCPILLFHADDDSAVPLSDNLAYVAAAKKAGKTVTFVRVATGDHYDSMINQGIPRGIEFMKQNGATPMLPIAPGAALSQ